jgi:hypothetical protein
MSFNISRRSAIALLAVVLFSHAAAVAQESVSTQLKSQLKKIANEALTAQYEILVSGDINGSLAKGKSFAHLYRAAMRGKFATQVKLRNDLLKTGQDFKRFETVLRFKEFSVSGNTAKVTATEQTELYMNVPGGPRSTGLMDEHIFEFTKANGQWELVSDTIPKPSTEPELSALDNDSPRGRRLAVGPRRGAGEMSFVNAGFVAPLRTNYDRAAAADYARQYAFNANPDYIIFGGTDCTNFVSQGLNAGGVPQAYGWYRSEDVWFYSCSVFGQTRATASWTWSKAKLLYNYLLFHTGATDFWINDYPEGHNPGLWPGDVVFADWDGPNGHQPDTQIDHAMFVTGRDTQGNLYISQHSPSRRDQPLSMTHSLEPAAKYEGFHIHDSF